jgi:hypothetical protein
MHPKSSGEGSLGGAQDIGGLQGAWIRKTIYLLLDGFPIRIFKVNIV